MHYIQVRLHEVLHEFDERLSPIIASPLRKIPLKLSFLSKYRNTYHQEKAGIRKPGVSLQAAYHKKTNIYAGVSYSQLAVSNGDNYD